MTTALLLFGATGDLAHRMLLPSLFGLDADQFLPAGFRIVATARSAMDAAAYRATAAEALAAHVDADRLQPEAVARFLGAAGGQPVAGYVDELGRPSTTETFVALKAHAQLDAAIAAGATVPDWLAHPSAVCLGGSWMVPRAGSLEGSTK